MKIPCTIHIEHDGPVSIDVVLQVNTLINSTLFALYDEAIASTDIDAEMQDRFNRTMPTLLDDAFWIERVDAGSSKIRGFIVGVFGAVMTALVAHPIITAVESTPLYQQMEKDPVGFAHRFIEKFREHNERQRHRDPMVIEALWAEDRVILYVKPSRRQLRMD